MALPRKGSRRITVEGKPFRWTVRPAPSYAQGNAWSPLSFAVQADDKPGRVLHVRLARPRPDNWMGEASSPVTSATVAAFIRQALQSGWNPDEPGGPFELKEGGQELPESG